jgi:hypothetical protein
MTLARHTVSYAQPAMNPVGFDGVSHSTFHHPDLSWKAWGELPMPMID